MTTASSFEKVSRRDFLKIGAAVGATAGVASLFTTEKAEAATWDTIDDIYPIDPDVFERYDCYRDAFKRPLAYYNEDSPSLYAAEGGPMPYPQGLIEPDPTDNEELKNFVLNIDTEKGYTDGDPGWTAPDYAYSKAATFGLMGSSRLNCVNIENEDGSLTPLSYYAQGPESFPNSPSYLKVAENKWEFDSLKQASYAIKKAAKKLNADLVGIAPYDERFIYKSEVYIPKDMSGNRIDDKVDVAQPVDFGFVPKSVIVMAFEMDYEGIKGAGSKIAEGAARQGYSRMAETALGLSVYIRSLGYNAYHCGNNISASCPEAIRAGLGEGGRSSIVITEEYGPRVRLSKVYTDLEFEYDKPKTFGVTEFCQVCQVCSDTCPSEAITRLGIDDPDNVAKTISAQAGVRKYYLDGQKCFLHWQRIDNGCNICVSVCPYNKPQTWNHELVKIVTRIPGLNSTARYFDHFFGWGEVPGEEEYYKFWREDI